jgi:hypothetical protein
MKVLLMFFSRASIFQQAPTRLFIMRIDHNDFFLILPWDHSVPGKHIGKIIKSLGIQRR